ncbi:hypothetical protein PR048_009706 [Dryococelus australis]|uniref:Uncharacterized protein n=1 Tax=Dryococelus australis TaxID=614101 RepID=A0ABQ9I2H6_9NEOP|nr:hypothetical protein PR048_009706 [Dryococelus australis]
MNTYGGKGLPVLGQVMVNTKHNNQSLRFAILVVKQLSKSMDRMQLARRIEIGLALHISVMVSQLRQKYTDVFKAGIGTIKSQTAALHLKPNVTPKFCKAQTVPYTLRGQVEMDDWATPLVCVEEVNGGLRLCAD